MKSEIRKGWRRDRSAEPMPRSGRVERDFASRSDPVGHRFGLRASGFGFLLDFGFRISDFWRNFAGAAVLVLVLSVVSVFPQVAKPAGPSTGQLVFGCDFEKADLGKLPGDFMVLNGEFTVAEEGGSRFLELPGAPLDTFSVLFGPAAAADVEVSARIFGTAKGRRAPTFAVGLGGVSGYKLRVSPGKTALELLKDEEIKASVPFEWKSGTWTTLRLRVRALKPGDWIVEGMAWAQGSAQPAQWQISCQEQAGPVAGRAAVVGSPFAGTPIRFDDLKMRTVGAK